MKILYFIQPNISYVVGQEMGLLLIDGPTSETSFGYSEFENSYISRLNLGVNLVIRCKFFAMLYYI